MDQLSDEEVEVRGEEDEEEEDSDKDDQDLDKMFGAWLGELDKLTQVHSRMVEQDGAGGAVLSRLPSVCVFRAWTTVVQNAPLSRKLPSDRRPTWQTSPTDSPFTTSTVRRVLMSRSSLLPAACLYSYHVVFVCRGPESGRERGPQCPHGRSLYH